MRVCILLFFNSLNNGRTIFTKVPLLTPEARSDIPFIKALFQQLSKQIISQDCPKSFFFVLSKYPLCYLDIYIHKASTSASPAPKIPERKQDLPFDDVL